MVVKYFVIDFFCPIHVRPDANAARTGLDRLRQQKLYKEEQSHGKRSWNGCGRWSLSILMD